MYKIHKIIWNLSVEFNELVIGIEKQLGRDSFEEDSSSDWIHIKFHWKMDGKPADLDSIDSHLKINYPSKSKAL